MNEIPTKSTLYIPIPMSILGFPRNYGEQERILEEIILITGKSKEEVEHYLKTHPISLEDYFRRLHHSNCRTIGLRKELSEIGEFKIKKLTMKLQEKIISIPYRLTYFISKAILWFAYQIWLGVQQAYLDIWDE